MQEFLHDGKALERLLQDYLDGILKRYLQSDHIPESHTGPIKGVAAENCDEIINNENKDLLIELHAPCCDHRKNLEPKYKELEEKLSEAPNIVSANMKVTENDAASLCEVRGFPTSK